MLATTLLFFLAVSRIDLASATAVAFVEPLVITILSHFLLKERVGVRRWAAVAIGFVGVLIVIRRGLRHGQPRHPAAGPVGLDRGHL